MAFGVVSKIIVGIFSILKIALATAIIIIVSTELYNVKVYATSSGSVIAYRAECLMAGSVNGSDVCNYTFAVCGLSMLLSLCTSLLLCLTCDLCGAGGYLELIVAGFQTAWWIIASIVITTKVKDTNALEMPDGSGVPKEEWRNAVAVMAWVTALIAALTTVVCLFETLKSLAECCGCCGYEKKGDKHKHKQHDDDDEPRPVDYAPNNPPNPPQPVRENDAAVRANAV